MLLKLVNVLDTSRLGVTLELTTKTFDPLILKQ